MKFHAIYNWCRNKGILSPLFEGYDPRKNLNGSKTKTFQNISFLLVAFLHFFIAFLFLASGGGVFGSG